MGIERNRPAPSPPLRLGGLRALLDSLGGRAPAGGSTEPSVTDLLDRLSVLRQGGPSAVPASLVEQLKRGSANALAPGAWQQLARGWQQASAAERSRLVASLAASGVRVEAGADGRFVSFVAGDLRVTAEPATQRLRRSQGGTILCYEGTVMARAMKINGNQVEVTTRDGSQVWQGGSGSAMVDGLPLVPRYAPRQAGEPPRAPWASPLSNDLREPRWGEGTRMADYAPAYDAAVRAMGGRVLEPSDPDATPADLYNCHSYAVTGGEGDLFDPFVRESHPHWLNNPMHRLTTGPFLRVHDDQRVQPGDVIVYRKDGKVTHTGVVREVDANGNPSLVESKFGILGRYLHEPFDIPRQYGAPGEYFRPESR